MVALWNRADHYIFTLWFLVSSFFPRNLSRCRLDGVALVRISDAGLKLAAHGSLEMQESKKVAKITTWAPSHNFIGLYLCN